MSIESPSPTPQGGQSLSADVFVAMALANQKNGYDPIPIGRRDKKGRFKAPWIAGHHGYDHKTATAADISDWPALVGEQIACGKSGILSLGAVLPPDVVGMDVDAYDGKHGLNTLKIWADLWGPLPPTYMVTARFDGSGIRLFRKPIDWTGQETQGSGIEFIDTNHRYVATPPSWHHTGKQYRLLTPEGKRRRSGILVPPPELPYLPVDYLQGLERTTQAGCVRDADNAEIADFEARYTTGPQPEVVGWVIDSTINAENANGTRNPTRDALCWAARESKGHRYGWADAVDKIRHAAIDSYEIRGQRFDAREFDTLVAFAVGQVRDLTEAACYDRWQSQDYKDAHADFASYEARQKEQPNMDDNGSSGAETFEPTEVEIRRAAKKYLLDREAKRLVAKHDAERLLKLCSNQAMDGVAFLESIEVGSPVWGSGSDVPWATRQGFMPFGTDGTGKSTLMQQIVFARMGLRDPDVLGFPVQEDDRPILYLALDRPVQIRQSMERMVNFNDPAVRDVLKRRLVVWSGHLPFQCDQDPEKFVDWCISIGGDDLGMIIGDSVKDMVSSCMDAEAGQGFQQTVQRIVDQGIEFGACHHNRKAHAENSKPRQLADVYGSRWLTAGMGSVVNIWKQSGVCELTQLKSPYGEPFKPVEYEEDYQRGESKPSAQWTDMLVSSLFKAGRAGLTDAEAVQAVFNISDTKDPGYNARRQKIVRVLTRWIDSSPPGGVAYERVDGERGGKPCMVWRLKSEEDDEKEALETGEKKARDQAERKKEEALRTLTEINSKIEGFDGD